MSAEAEAEGARTGMQAALDAIETWRKTTHETTSRRIAELDEEQAQLREDLAELQRQLDNVTTMRAEAAENLAGLPAEHERRAYAAVLAGLKADADIIAVRSEAYREAVDARDARAQTLLEEPGISAKVDEFEDFERRREQLLAALPKSYHSALLQQHEAVRSELKPLFDAMSAEISPVSEELVELTLVASMDSVESVPEALAVILPVGYAVHGNWDKHGDDLAALLAYRVVAAVSGALRDIGVPNAPVVYAPYEYGQEQLAIQVWLKDSDVNGPLKPALEAQIATAGQAASELRAAGLKLSLTWQPPEVIAPSTTEQEG